MADVVEDFYGVYLLYNLNARYKGHVYIGFTVDPNRRISQHNKGVKGGGARKTSNKGPWEMVMIVHGFPNEISALRFEWAWQNPKKSRRLRLVTKKRKNEFVYDYSVRVLSEMLRTGPWNRLPLTVRWLNEQYCRDFPTAPPVHMAIVYGYIISKKLTAVTNSTSNNDDTEVNRCELCKNQLNKDDEMECLNPVCNFRGHLICLSTHFLANDKENLIPIQGNCPKCELNLLWGDLVRKRRGCYNHL